MDGLPAAVTGPALDRADQWIRTLDGSPKGRIVAEHEDRRDDNLLLAICMQQWPRLRRAFRFCSFSAEDRSTTSNVFDLQLVDGGRSTRSGEAATIVAARPDILEWPSPWTIQSIDAARLIGFVDLDTQQAGAIVAALIGAGRDDCSTLVGADGLEPPTLSV